MFYGSIDILNCGQQIFLKYLDFDKKKKKTFNYLCVVSRTQVSITLVLEDKEKLLFNITCPVFRDLNFDTIYKLC